MPVNEMTEKRSWYREPWVWLLIALPMAAVIAGMFTIYLAVTSSDGLVVDDYYKRGKAINLDLARDQAAANYKLEAVLRIDSQNGQVTVTLISRDHLQPEHVRLLLLHPTRAGYDQNVLLKPAGEGIYRGTLSPVASANWHVQLAADDWRLAGRMELPQAAPHRLGPQDLPDSGSQTSR